MTEQHLISDNTKACMDIWCVGDGFLDDIQSVYKSMEYQALRNKKIMQFYMSDYYNVKFFCNPKGTGVSARNATARLVNSMTIEALNSDKKLPKILIMVIDKDIIDSIIRLWGLQGDVRGDSLAYETS